jgi:hypothetical protein
MANLTRRSFLLSSAAFSVGCTMRRSGREGAQAPSAIARQPAVGQSWRYVKRDIYSHAIVDEQVDLIAAVGRTIDLDSRSETTTDVNANRPTWGTAWLSKYVPHRDSTSGPLPSEVQDPWGVVLVDPHWNQVQVYQSPIPLWPTELTPGWKTHVSTKYKTPGNEDALPWEQTMVAHNWEIITVPAGEFRALRFTNMVNFISTDFSRSACQRQETVWFAPEVGRWVVRESTGSYYIEDSSVDTPYSENGYRWELLEWT